MLLIWSMENADDFKNCSITQSFIYGDKLKLDAARNATGVALCHALELPNKMALSATTWLDIQKILYNGFGKVLGPVECSALLTTLFVLFLIRKRRRTFILTLVSSVSIAIALIV